MATYPIKMLKDEQGTPFVPLTSTVAIRDEEGKTVEQIVANKLSPTNIKEGENIIISVSGNDVTITASVPDTTVLIDNLSQIAAGVGALDARQGKVLYDTLQEQRVPSGGSAGQVLKKKTNTDNDLEWGDAADPNAISGDSSIKKIIALTYEEYQALEAIDPYTEYHIIDAQSSIDSLTDFVGSIILETDKRKHPIGSIEFNVSGTNPSVYLGFGTWELWGAGKVPVGVDVTQDEFNTVEKTGGSKYLQSHNHNIWQAAGSEVRLSYGSGGTYNKVGLTYNWDAFPDNESIISTTDVNNLSTGNSGNLPPYITCYMWKRVL